VAPNAPETDYTVRHVDARFVMPFFCELPTLLVRHAELTITAPGGDYFHAETRAHQVHPREKRRKVVIASWTTDNLPATRGDDGPKPATTCRTSCFFVREASERPEPQSCLSGVPELYMYADFVTHRPTMARPATSAIDSGGGEQAL
jgi:hypothetical protein